VELNLTDQEARDLFCRAIDKNFSVIASAGAGKTRAVVDRIVTIAKNGRDDLLPRLVVVTYTNNAAHEFKRRIRSTLLQTLRSASARAILQRLELTFFGTIHSFCIRLLREHHAHLRLPDQLVRPTDPVRDRLWLEFVGDPEFSRMFAEHPLVSEILRFCTWQELLDLAAQISQPLSRTVSSGCPPPLDLAPLENCSVRKQSLQRKKEILAEFQKFKIRLEDNQFGLVVPTSGTEAQDLAEACSSVLGPLVTWLEEASLSVANEIAVKFQRECHRQGIVTFNDQIALSRRLVDDQAILDRLRKREYSVILDEAQDTEQSMFEILIEITRPIGEPPGTWLDTGGDGPLPGRFSMVGDPRQSIYERAAPKLYHDLNEGFRKSETGDLLRFQCTMRCAKSVVETVNHIFQNAEISEEELPYNDLLADRDARTGFTGRIHIPPPDPETKRPVDQIFSEECLTLAEWLKDEGKAGLGIYSWSQVATIAPRHEWLSLCADQLRKKSLPFVYRNQKIKWNALPAFTWPVSILYTLANPWDDFERLGVLREIFGISDTALALWRYDPEQINNELAKAVELLKSLEKVLAEDKSITLARLVDRIIADCRLESLLRAAGHDPSNLDSIAHRAYVADIDNLTLHAWTGDLLALLNEPADIQTETADAIELITSHSAKGLEWDIVIPIGFGRGINPGRNPTYPCLIERRGIHRVIWNSESQSAALEKVDNRSDAVVQARNRRLLYVTLTRARQALLFPAITYKEGTDSFRAASGFDLGRIAEVATPLPPITAPLSDAKYEQGELPMEHTDYSFAGQRSHQIPELIRPHALVKDEERPEDQFTEAEDEQGSYHYGRWWHLWVERFPWYATAAEQEKYAQSIDPGLPFAERAVRETKGFLNSGEIAEIISTGEWFRSEVAFSHPVTGTRWIEGVIDLVVGTRSQEIWIIDWKTNQKAAGESDFQFAESLRTKYLLQLESYGSVLEQGFSRKVTRLLIYSTFLARFV
jgi:ATP-dependent exoDNAse (exonuclease V) beta subunit